MSDEQLARIENKIDSFGTKFKSIDTRFDSTDAKLTSIDSRVEKNESKFAGIDSRFDQLGAEMRALHEATKHEIQLVAEGQAVHREETARGFDVVRKVLADSIAPLSDAIRHHSEILKSHGNANKTVRIATAQARLQDPASSQRPLAYHANGKP